MTQAFALWLVPAPPLEAPLQQLIQDLAEAWGGDVFQAHMTLASGSVASRSVLEEEVAQLGVQTPPLTLPVCGVGTSPQFFKSVFFRLDWSCALLALQKAVQQTISAAQVPVFPPHLSLFYGELSIAKRLAIYQRNLLRPKSISFNRMLLVYPRHPTKGWRGISDWEVVQQWEMVAGQSE